MYHKPKPLPEFQQGDVLKASSLQKLSAAIAASRTTDGRTVGGPPDLAVILDEDLDAPISALQPTKAKCTVCLWDPRKGDHGEYEQTERREDAFNHAEETDHEEDTFGLLQWVDGHYIFFGDCGPMADRETPPWESA